MKEKIVEQIAKARQEAIMWANHEIKAIVVKYQGRKDKKQLLEEELLKAKEFQDSAVGDGYINSLAPIFESDEALVSAIADYYMRSKVVTNPDTRIGWTEESTLDYVHNDSLLFLRRYYLAGYISKMLFPPINSTLLSLFKDENEARKFLSHLNPNSKATEVVRAFREFSPYSKPSDIGETPASLYRAISPNYYGQGEKTLRNKFNE